MDSLKIVVGGIATSILAAAIFATSPVWLTVAGGIIICIGIGVGLDYFDNKIGLTEAIKKGVKEWFEADLDFVPIEGELVSDWTSDI